jgi:hypothetical protein
LVSLKVRGGAHVLKVFLLGCQMKEDNVWLRVNISYQSEPLQESTDNFFLAKDPFTCATKTVWFFGALKHQMLKCRSKPGYQNLKWPYRTPESGSTTLSIMIFSIMVDNCYAECPPWWLSLILGVTYKISRSHPLCWVSLLWVLLCWVSWSPESGMGTFFHSLEPSSKCRQYVFMS